jgi:hypothetical protein
LFIHFPFVTPDAGKWIDIYVFWTSYIYRFGVELMHNITFDVGPAYDQRTVTIPIPSEKGKRLLVSVSGGADSAVMLFILALYNRDLGLEHTIIPLTVNKVDGAEIHSRKVIQWIRKALGVQIADPIIGGDHSMTHDQIVHQLLLTNVASNEYDFVYVGENKIPPIPFPFGEDNDFPGLAPARKGNPSASPKVILPFSDLYKYHTIDLYFKLGILELLEYAHSCTERPVGRCMVCWQCCERKWAFRELQKKDPGLV